jgi:hypothetical protein
MDKMDRELTSVIKEFDRVVDVEALCLAKKNGKHNCLNQQQFILNNLV